MMVRGKFRSLTLINWNGFFARTFDLDALVTTLSGGNGAGKSTTMAAFITALIPDLSLLHFRNTTEAGSTAGSRDKGLYGKLRAGVCYAVLDTVNSRQQRIVAGVRLQQVAGRDKKVDLRAFSIHGLTDQVALISLLTETVQMGRARVLPLHEVKTRLDGQPAIQFRQYNVIADYHTMMFDCGLVPRRLRSAADRSKFYRLIESSLYGGISSAITRSLRDYLLPENSGVRKAFHDMEAALRENRMTLEAIRITQADRDLFKHLITETTQYVSADYMRHANERKEQLQAVLAQRSELFTARKQLIAEQDKQAALAQALTQLAAVGESLERDYQACNDHLSLVQSAQRYWEKIERYRDDMAEITLQLEEQSEIVVDAHEQYALAEAQAETAAQEVDELKSQLADYQQALDVQQTRAIKYQQALQALARAQSLCQSTELNSDNAQQWQHTLHQREQQATEQLLTLEQSLRVADATHAQFAQALTLLQQIVGEVDRVSAWQTANQLLRDVVQQRNQAMQLPELRQRLAELRQRAQERQEAERLLASYIQHAGETVALEQLTHKQAQLAAQLAELSDGVTQANEQRLAMEQQRQQIAQHIAQHKANIIPWLAAQEALVTLHERTQHQFTHGQQIMAYMQTLLESEREQALARDAVLARKRELEKAIEQLGQSGGVVEGELTQLATRFNGVLLSDIYEDISLEDAPYFSALYGPARCSIVVPDLNALREQLAGLDSCPEDLYLIEGDANAFDETLFTVEELDGAVLVKVGERQWRYSRFPTTPLFGRAARESRLAELEQARDTLAGQAASLSIEIQKIQRQHQLFSTFVGTHLAVAFNADPEAQIKQLMQQEAELVRARYAHAEAHQQQQQRFTQLSTCAGLLDRILPCVNVLADETLSERIATLVEQLAAAEQATEFLRRQETRLHKLETMVGVLQHDPEQHDQLVADHQQAKRAQHDLRQQLFAITEVVERQAHFSYSDAAEMVAGDCDLNTSLRQRLTQSEGLRTRTRESLRQQRTVVTEQSQRLAELKSAHAAKQEILDELTQEVHAIGVQADADAVLHAQQRRDQLYSALNQNRLDYQQQEKQLTFCEVESNNLQKKLQQFARHYYQLRTQIVTAKVGWCDMLRLVRESGAERRLHRRELAWLQGDELRSISDKALGALRIAVADNEHLRDVLRASEEPRHPERKIRFYIAVNQHLRARIRQDIIHTDDPIEAIEQMEFELNRLTEELTSREQMLAISARGVANIIRKTIQREQNRIRQLNQGLQTVRFGQVCSVRLNVNVRETHATLLDTLAQDHDQHQDLFTHQRFTFSEALAKLFQRLNPQIETGQISAQTLGEALLDYRNYLEMEVEVNRGAEGWLRAESGALSTGEAIGTGMSILVMVVQSWEDESRRLREKDILPCRLLFLDEAARLDARSISTLFELCERLNMQLIIAAPENISPERGTTYKLVRKMFNDNEYVHVVGLRGFGTDEAIVNAS